MRAQPTRSVGGKVWKQMVIETIGISAMRSTELAITVVGLRVEMQAAISSAFIWEVPMNPASFISTMHRTLLTGRHL